VTGADILRTMADERYVDAPPAGADGWRGVWTDDLRFRARSSKFEPLLGPVRRLVRRVFEPDAERQKNFNLTLLALLDDLRAENRTLRQELRSDIEAVQRDLATVQQQLAASIGTESARLHDLVVVASKRNDALLAALDQKVETVAVRVRDAVNPSAGPAPSADVLYRRLEDALRGSEPEVRAGAAHYATLAAAHQPLLDVGCGRGELLTACAEQGIEARGVDTNERSVADLRARGLDVQLAAIPECFTSVADGSLGSVAAMHVVEHLPVDALFALFREAARVLRRGGLLMIETPNAESIVVSASDFWRDPTHLAPRHPAALTLLAREHGFEIAEARPVHEIAEGAKVPIRENDPPELQRVVQAINERFFAPQDFRLVLRRL
jgi:2-polyprenyl-3-methyl-5-hydroxy-6-metoxy-1,4-benzoquinol methylase